jgi:hypothetical protein|nr:MAG TPA_asm: hypothetical protein [Caudoviricetes sp.]
MSKNLIPQIAEMLGLQLGEAFKIKGDNELTYRFTNDGLELTHDSGIELAKISASVALVDLVNGKGEIIKLPWKPKEGESYWTFILYDCDIRLGIEPRKWTDDMFDFAFLKAGWIYRTYEEAEAALPAVAAEIGVEYAP